MKKYTSATIDMEKWEALLKLEEEYSADTCDLAESRETLLKKCAYCEDKYVDCVFSFGEKGTCAKTVT